MSLKIWLPLNGNTNNQGLLDGNLGITSASFVDGKFGKSLQNGQVIIPAAKAAEVLNNKAITIAFWIYVNADTGSSNKTMLFGNDNMGNANNNRKFSLFQYPSCNDLHWSWMNNDGSNTFICGVLTGVLPSYKWTHVAVTYENPDAKVYINGVLTGESSGVSSSSSFAYDTLMIWNSPYHRFNDYRIYDNALSAKEVKLLSQGLVCHYPMNQPERAKNLISDSLIHMTSNVYGFANKYLNLTAGKHYTLFANGHVDDGNGYLRVYIYNSSWSQSNNAGTQSKTDTTIAMGFTPNTTGQYMISAYSYLSQGTPGGNVTLNWYKLVEGSYTDMQWSPSESDSLNYGNTEYDTSGFNNHGTATALTLNQNSPRYKYCYGFDGNGQYIKTSTASNIYAILNSNTYTISCWVYGRNLGSDYQAYFVCRTPSGGTMGCQVFLGIKSWKIIHSYYSDDWEINYTLSNNNWYHIVFTSDNKNVICYVNGAKVASTIKQALNISSYAVPTLGADSDRSGAYFNGSISDFRIYTTALSAQDVQELYNTPVSLSNTGTLMTQGEFIEE